MASVQKIDLKENMEGLVLTKAAAETLSEQTRHLINLNLHRNFIVQDTETVVRFVMAGNGIGIVSRFSLNAVPNELVRCNITPPVQIKIGIVTRDFVELSPAAKEFVRMLEATISKQIE